MRKFILFYIFTVSFSFQINAQISGSVFRDYNGDGIQNNTPSTSTTAANIENGIAGVIIKAYNISDILIATQITNASGIYIFPVGSGLNQIPNATTVRLEYELPENCVANGSYDFDGTGAAAYGSNVQFKTQAASAVSANFGISNPAQYRGTLNNPKVFIPRQSNGNPVATPVGNAATQVAMYSFNYSANGNTTTGNNARTSLATAAQIGSCWGVAYNKFNNRIYTSALVKRHSGLGPGGPAGSPNPVHAPGAIYMANPNITNSGSFFFSMDALGGLYNTHNHTPGAALNVRDNVARNLNRHVEIASTDAAAFDQTGKTGIGDIELSEDGRYLWLTNLYDSKLYRVDFVNPAAPVAPTPATASAVITSWGLPVLTCTGNLRPWGIKWYKQKIYVGVVCTGENDANTNNTGNINTNFNGTTVTGGSFNLGNAYVLEFNPAGAGSWSIILTIPLNQPRGNAADENFNITRWYNWASNFNVLKAYPTNTSGALIHPQPILSNLEFDIDGSLMISFMDRLSIQTGFSQPDLSGSSSYYGELGGDLVRAYNNGCVYEMETNAKEGISSPKPATAGANTGTGPGAGVYGAGGVNYGEFYWDERYFYPSGPYWAHTETSLGNLAFLPGTNEVMSGMMDPFDIYSNGVGNFNNTTGGTNSRYEIITVSEPGTFRKASSLGDIEIITPLAPIEIGNRVWMDADADGIQDAGEGGLAGVEIELLNNIGNIIATVTTDINGNYYFSSLSGTNITGIAYNINISTNTNYTIRIKGTVVGNNTISGNAGLGSTHYCTLPNVIGNGKIDLSDNDGINVGGAGGTYEASFTTGGYGQNNHNIDFGFTALSILPVSSIKADATLKNEIATINWTTINEIDTKEFYLQYSTNNINFTEIDSLPAKNNGSFLNKYSVEHHINNGFKNIYYRVKLVSFSGAVQYSNTVFLNVNDQNTVTAWPNPYAEKITINITLKQSQKVAINLLDSKGNLVKQENRNLAKGANMVIVNGLQLLQKGTYILKVNSFDGSVKFTQKLVKK